MKIKSITEAFSTLPIKIEVCDSPLCLMDNIHNKKCIKEIKEENRYVDGDPFNVYNAYSYNGILLHSYLQNTVNVSYFPE